MMKQANVRRKDGKTWLEGVPDLGFGRGRECTFAGALEAASQATDWPVDYDSIMGWSGLAFRLRWYVGDTGPRWCMSSPCGEFEREVEATRRATGWELSMECRLDRKDTAMEDFAPRIAEEIEAGRPVLACDPQLNMAVIVGCADARRIVFLPDYMSGKPELDLATGRLGGLICFLGEAIAAYEEQARRLGEPLLNHAAFHGPWTGLGLDDWTDEVRVREVAVLEQTMELEAVAVGELENLLEASAVAMPAVH